MSRFDYVKYDDSSASISETFKNQCIEMEELITIGFKSPRAKALALTKLEEMFMWIGKGIRDDQVQRDVDFANAVDSAAKQDDGPNMSDPYKK